MNKSTAATKFGKYKSNLRAKNKRAQPKKSLKPINPAKLFVHELKRECNLDLQRIISDCRREFYINIYKSVFRCWFTYAVTGCLLALCHAFVRSGFSFCFPPIVVTIFLLWKVSSYKRGVHHFTLNDMELLNQTQSAYFTYKTVESRREHQGVLLAYLKERNFDLIDSDLEEIFDDSDGNLSDLALESDDEMTLDHDSKSKSLVAYMIYSKQRDEPHTVCIKEMCVASAYRRRRVGDAFLRKVCAEHFKAAYGFKTCKFNVSSFHWDAMAALNKKTKTKANESGVIKRDYCWSEYKFVPGVRDERTMYHFDIDEFLLKKI